MSVNSNRWSVVLLASLFLFAQYALATQDCLLEFDRAAETHNAAMEDDECGSLPMDARVCMMHVVAVDQSASAPDHHFTASASPASATPQDFLLVATRAAPRELCDSRLHVPRASRVLFCSYQT